MIRMLNRDCSAQTAAFDAILTLIILMMASTAIYTGVLSTMTTTSESRKMSELREAAEAGGNAALIASVSSAYYTDLETRENKLLENLTGEDLVRVLHQLITSGRDYNISDLVKVLRELYQLALFGHEFAVFIYGPGINMLFSGPGIGTEVLEEIPHPRVVVTKEVVSGHDLLGIDLYVW